MGTEHEGESLQTGAMNISKVVEGGVDLDFLLGRLRHLSSQLNVSGQFVMYLTVLNIVLTLSLLASGCRNGDFAQVLCTQVGLALGIGALSLTVACERLRRRGDVLFQEISDELQWDIRASTADSGKGIASERPPLDARMILRTFARAGDLPLVPGTFGPAVYAAINLLILLILAWRYGVISALF